MTEKIYLCDGAREHLLPWLAGRLDGTPEGEAFEAHVRECKACSALVTDRRRAMQAVLALAEESRAVAAEETTQPAGSKQMQLPSWSALVRSKGTAILTAAAALLLIVSYSMKPSEGLVGEKALPSAPREGRQPSTETSTQTTETTHSVTATADGETLNAPGTQEQPGENAVAAETSPQPSPRAGRGQEAASRKASSKRRPARPVKTTPAPSKSNKRNAGTVEVYDESGRLIGSATIGGQK